MKGEKLTMNSTAIETFKQLAEDSGMFVAETAVGQFKVESQNDWVTSLMVYPTTKKLMIQSKEGQEVLQFKNLSLLIFVLNAFVFPIEEE
jgi:hypothetical protein